METEGKSRSGLQAIRDAYEGLDAEVEEFREMFIAANDVPEERKLVEEEIAGAFKKPEMAARAKVMAILSLECLGEETLLAAMGAVAGKKIRYLTEFLRFETPELSTEATVRLISLLGSHGQLNFIPDVSWREVMRPEPEGSPGHERCGRIRRQAEASILEAVDVLSGGKATPDGRRIKDAAEINAFLAYSLKNGDDGLVLDIIGILERNKFYGPIGMVALSAVSSHVVRSVAKQVLHMNDVPLELIPMGIKALEGRREVVFPGGEAVEHISWKQRPVLDGGQTARRGIKKLAN